MRNAAIAALLAAISTDGAAATSADNVYALCTVRDVTVEDDRMKGKVYRSAIFSAPANYDSDISLTPERGGAISAEFERWVSSTHGLRPDRMSLGNGDEHYCIEVAATESGEQQLVSLVQEWSTQPNSGIEHVLTVWYPERLAKRVGYLKPPSSEAVARYRAALEKREQVIAADQQELRQDAANAQRALAAHEAELARVRAAQAEYERKRHAYREEYRRIMGRYPDE